MSYARIAPAAREETRRHTCERCGTEFTQLAVAVVRPETGEKMEGGWAPQHCPSCTRRWLSASAHAAARLL